MSKPKTDIGSDERAPTLEEFKAFCRSEFDFLKVEHGFVEVSPVEVGGYLNPFEVHFAKGQGRLIIVGVRWGLDVDGKLQDGDGNQVPLHHLAPKGHGASHRQGLGRGQWGGIRYAAFCMRHFAGPILNGDWSGVSELARKAKQKRDETMKKERLENERFEASRAVFQARPLFANGNYAEVVRLLMPHERHLSRAEHLRLELARRRS